MRRIVKRKEPVALKEFRSGGGKFYEDLRGSAKTRLRNALFDEQQGLCCYCMNSIVSSEIGMKIEHWRSQKKYPDEQLRYANLLGACRGNDDRPKQFQHCDTRKGDADLSYNPANAVHAIESRVFYEFDGRIRSHEEAFDQELNDVLNLNIEELVSGRRLAIEFAKNWYKKKKQKIQGPVPKSQIQRKIQESQPSHGTLRPFIHVAVWWLQRKLSK